MAERRSRAARSRPEITSTRRRRPKKTIPQTVEVVFAREHFSHSALKQLQRCPLRYRLQRIDRVKPSHRSPSLVLGGVYHRVLATALQSEREGESVPAEALRLWFDDFLAEELDSGGPPIRWTEKVTPENQRDLGQTMVAAWHEQGLPLFARAEEILAVETPFCVELVRSDGRALRTPLAGIIDAIVRRKDGTVAIIDHKTAKQRYSETCIDLDLQATAYTYAARALGHGDCEFEFHTMLKRKKPELAVVPAARDDDSFGRLFWVARQAERLIESGAFMPAAPGWLCDSCEYGYACAAAHRPMVIPVREASAAAS